MNIFVYGSCVSRDLMPEFYDCGHSIVHYTARQSLVSAVGKQVETTLDLSNIESKFQRRSVQSDLNSDLFDEFRKHANVTDVILWDMIDERNGYYSHGDQVLTNSWEVRQNGIDKQLSEDFVHVAFGSDEHFANWVRAVNVWTDELSSLGLSHRVILIAPAFASRFRDGGSFESDIYDLDEMSTLFDRYYRYIADNTQFKVVGATELEVATDRNHQWGAEIYHFDKSTREILASRALSFFGLCTLSPDEHSLYVAGYDAGFHLPPSPSFIGSIEVVDFVQPVRFDIDPVSDRVVFFFNGAVDPDRSQGKAVFQRSSWSMEVTGSCVFLADPTLVAHPRLSLGWGQGKNGASALPLMAGMVHGLVDNLGGKKVVFFGSSVGGFQALMVGSLVPLDVEIRVNNPQTDWLKYDMRGVVAQVISDCFPGESQIDFRSRHEFWVKPMSIWERTGRVPLFDYYLNEASVFDVRDQWAPLKLFLDSIAENPTRGNARSIHYFDRVAGHNPLGKEATIAIING